MSNASLITNSQTMIDNGSLFSGTDISRILSALMVAESELVAARVVLAEVDEYVDAIQKPDFKSLNFALNGIAKTLARSHADVLKAVRKEAWDECLDAIEKHELNTKQARAGNPYRDTMAGADRG